MTGKGVAIRHSAIAGTGSQLLLPTMVLHPLLQTEELSATFAAMSISSAPSSC